MRPYTAIAAIAISSLGTVASAAVLQLDKTARPGWHCPNGKSFEACDHACKWIHSTDGVVDFARETVCAPDVIEHSPLAKAVTSQIDEVFNSCGKTRSSNDAGQLESNYTLIQRTHACNYFATMALDNLWGIKDFYGSRRAPMSAAAIHRYLKDPLRGGKNWKVVDGAVAQIEANAGKPVVAVSSQAEGHDSNHIAVVTPGAATWSNGWKSWAPVITQVSLGEPKKTCKACFANTRFGRSRAPDYFVRSSSPRVPAQGAK